MVVRVSRADKVTTQLVAHHIKYMNVLTFPGIVTPVAGVGDPLAPIVFIVDEPHTFDAPHPFFTPRVNNLFGKALRVAGMHHSQVYVTAVLKQRRQRDQWHESELIAASALLRWEVDLIRPRVIVTLGALAEHTWRHNKAAYLVVHSVHPSLGLIRASVRKRLYLDLEQAVRLSQP